MTDTTQPITAFKGMDKNFQCRGFQYAVGETYTHEGKVVGCNSGFHACENPLDVLDYYPLDCDTRFAIVKASGSISRDGNKLASASMAIEAELRLPEFIAHAINYVKAVCNQDKAPEPSGDNSQLAASGDNSELAASGDNSKLAASGDNSKLAASGYNSKLAASGNNSQLAASGDNSKLAASGDYSKLAASGDNSKLAASGDYSQLAASGDYSQLAASGDNSKLAASGDYSIAVGVDENCMAKAGEGGCIALRWTKDKKPRLSVAYVGENGIKADTYYKLDKAGEFVEVEA